MSNRVDHSIRLGPAVVQQQEHRRQAHQDREQRAREPANTPDMVGQNRLVMRCNDRRSVVLLTVLAEMTRPVEPVDRKDAQRGKRGPYASGLGRWPQHLKSLAIERHPRRYPVWLNIPMKTNNGQPARGVLGPWGAVNDTTEALEGERAF